MKRNTLYAIIGGTLVVGTLAAIVVLVVSHFSAESMKQELLNRSTANSTGVSTSEAERYIDHNQNLTPIEDGVASIEIRSVSIKAPILDGTDDNTLAVAVGRVTSTSEIGGGDNCCLAGHSSSRFTCVFNELHKVKVGDEILLTDVKGNHYTYYMHHTMVVNPEDTYVLNQSGRDMLTLITCTDNNTRRLCVIAYPEKMRTQEDEERDKVRSKIDELRTLNREIGYFDLSHAIDGGSGE